MYVWYGPSLISGGASQLWTTCPHIVVRSQHPSTHDRKYAYLQGETTFEPSDEGRSVIRYVNAKNGG